VANISLNQERIITNSSIGKFNIKQISKILLRRRFFVLGISGVVISIASLLAVITKPNYQSSMEIIVSSNLYIQGGAGSKFTKQNPQFIDYTSQMKLMLNSQLIEKAVVLLSANYPDITLEDIKGKQENGKEALLEVIQLEGRMGASQIFEVSFNGDDPVKTQKVLQALQKVYQNYNREQQKKRLNQGLAFVHVRLTEIKKAVNQAEKNLEQFRKKHNLVDPQVQSKVLIESLAGVQKQLQTIRAQIQDVRTQYNNLEQKMASLSQNTPISLGLNQSSRYQSLLSEIQKTELALSKEQLRYTDDSPTITGLKQQLQSQIILLRQEIKRLGEENNNNSKEQQLAGVNPQLAQDLIQVQTTALGLIANEKSLVESEQQIRSELSKYPNIIAEYNRITSQISINRKTLDELLQTQQSLGLKIAQGGVDWQVIEEPSLGVNTSNNRLLILLGGIVSGPILGVALALTWGLFNRVIYSPRELQKLTNLRLLGSIPKLAPRAVKKRLPSLSLNGEPNLAASVVEATTWLPCHEALDMVYQNIQIFKYPFPLKSLIITSALSGEGKTTLVLGLAASAAHMHKRVLVIDANLRHPHLHNMLQLSNDWGLSLLLVDEENTHIQDYIQPIHPSIDILTAGPTPEDTVELFSSQRMQELIELFEQTYDLVLIDAPSILGTVDTRILASFCNGIIMVGRIGKITQTQLIEATGILSELNLIGFIANEVRNSHNI
jgi:polysaccharide biosynthesis transport protein